MFLQFIEHTYRHCSLHPLEERDVTFSVLVLRWRIIIIKTFTLFQKLPPGRLMAAETKTVLIINPFSRARIMRALEIRKYVALLALLAPDNGQGLRIEGKSVGGCKMQIDAFSEGRLPSGKNERLFSKSRSLSEKSRYLFSARRLIGENGQKCGGILPSCSAG